MSEGLLSLAGHPERVKAIHNSESDNTDSEARNRVIEMLQVAKLFQPAAAIRKCCTNEGMLYCGGCGDDLRMAARHCRHRLCPTCQRRKAFRISKEVEATVNVLQQNNPGLRLLFITLTVPACVEEYLVTEQNNLITAFSKLIRRVDLKAHLIGAVRILEVDFNRTAGMYQPHIHALLAVRATYFSKGYLSQRRLVEMWREASGREAREVKVETVKPDQKNSLSPPQRAAELVRYAMKPVKSTDWTPASLAILYKTTRNRHLYDFFWAFKSVRKHLEPYQAPCVCSACAASQPA